MEIKTSQFELEARTKKELCQLPVSTDCELHIFIGSYGFAKIVVRQKEGNGPQRGDFGDIATITIHNEDEMERVGRVLLALANAHREVNSSRAKVKAAALTSSPV